MFVTAAYSWPEFICKLIILCSCVDACALWLVCFDGGYGWRVRSGAARHAQGTTRSAAVQAQDRTAAAACRRRRSPVTHHASSSPASAAAAAASAVAIASRQHHHRHGASPRRLHTWPTFAQLLTGDVYTCPLSFGLFINSFIHSFYLLEENTYS